MRLLDIVVKTFMLGCVMVILSAHQASGQDDQSMNFTAPSMIYHGTNTDNVSLPMGNQHTSIPLLHLKGRGLDFDINASYNSKMWVTTEYDDPYSGLRAMTTSIDSGLPNPWTIGVPRMGGMAGGLSSYSSV